ncbi:hypothetical protein [Streptomyces tirandamycinicus]|uniref:Uncharacterized protein n=1 Tax=Streptomyces tirandamycinicus TaxID=2174846 RepID=A0A2S1T1X1_9ACTN|nr:hypothetical protein [Streptomyces tirandamycinicus]AWI32662.1 hypothetical protein DDW44_30560 [Streptomyces tirandamycinicus]
MNADLGGFSTWRTRMVRRLRAAQMDGLDGEAAQLAAELMGAHILLGERRLGTAEEQRAYLLARSTGTPLPELAAVGLDTNTWPAPPHSSPALAEPESASPATEERIMSLFRSAGPLGDRRLPGPRYEVRHRPEDGQRYKGRPLPWAIWDTREDLPVSYHCDQELAEYQAEQASERFARRSRPG